MWTLCWTDNEGNDIWDRFSSRIQLKSFIDRHELDVDELLIFPPEADDLVVSASELYPDED